MRKADDQRRSAETGRQYVIDANSAEILFSRGRLDLNEQQLCKIEAGSDVELTKAQFESLGRKVEAGICKWVDALEAVHLLAPYCGGDANAKHAIAERLIDGAIRCSFVWSCDCIDLGIIPHSRPVVSKNPFLPGTAFSVTPPKPLRSRSKLGGAFRLFSDDWARDQQRWDWVSGTFVGVRTGKGLIDLLPEAQRKTTKVLGRMYVVHGVQLDVFHIEKLALSISQRSALKAFDRFKTSGRGRKEPRNKKYNFAPILAKLETDIANGTISELGDVTDYGMQAQLERRIALHFSPDDCPSESTIRRKAKRLLAVWQTVANG